MMVPADATYFVAIWGDNKVDLQLRNYVSPLHPYQPRCSYLIIIIQRQQQRAKEEIQCIPYVQLQLSMHMNSFYPLNQTQNVTLESMTRAWCVVSSNLGMRMHIILSDLHIVRYATSLNQSIYFTDYLNFLLLPKALFQQAIES